MLAHTEVSFGRGERRALQLLSLSEVWLPTSELELQVTLISKIFHFPCIVALQNGSSSCEWRWKTADFFRAKGKPHQNHITDRYDGAPTVAWTLSFILLQKRTGSDLPCWCLISISSQVPPAAEGLVTVTTLVSVQQKPKDYFKPTSLCCSESQKSGKLQTQTQNLVLWDHLLM